MAKLNISQFRGQITKGDLKDIPNEACYEVKNMINRKGRYVTRPGAVKFSGLQQGAINLIYNFKRIARGSINLMQSNTKLYACLNPDFIAVPLMGEKPLTVYFFCWTTDWDGEITAWKWNFGDGGSSTAKNPVHTYTSTGKFDVTLTVFVGTLSFSITRYGLIFVFDTSIIHNDDDWDDDYNRRWYRYRYEITHNPLIVSITPDKVYESEAKTLTVVCRYTQFSDGKPPQIFALGNASDLKIWYDTNITVVDKTTFTGALPAWELDAGVYDAMVVDYEKRQAISKNIFEVKEVVNFDTYIFNLLPTANYSTRQYLYVWWNGSELYRTIIKTPGNPNKILHLYNFADASTNVKVKVYEVDPATFDIATVTWNTQPNLGNLITTITVLKQSWITMPTGTTEALLLKLDDESSGNHLAFRSFEYIDANYRPYITDT